MKNLFQITVILAVLVSASAGLAFHDGGVAECAGCHTMHNSQDGLPVDAANPNGNNYLLKTVSATEQCLTCHAGYGQFNDGLGFGPGGDFYWVTKTFGWSAHGHNYESTGDSHGHNVISADIAQDAVLSSAPGGGTNPFQSAYLGCTSCHDPHGNQNFRILYGSDLGPRQNGTRFNFTADAPEALGNSRTTSSDSGKETDSHHTIYKNGMSDWCGNCHGVFHSEGTGGVRVHPTRAMGSNASANYNAYISSDQLVGGVQATAYRGLVPFEDVDVVLGDPVTGDPGNYTKGPDSNDKVMCLTCHRAHASPFADAARWDMGETFLIESHPRTGDTGATADDIARKYYEYTFVDNQRSLCNKCHVKDYGDGPYVP